MICGLILVGKGNKHNNTRYFLPSVIVLGFLP